ncbi:MAG TPA: pectate lyase, partial [Verrucomicrobiae bacterium]|nr:pectate lyase [Verrucomicrobiae bacterium]
SHCGYAGGDQPIPDAPVKVLVSPVKGDEPARIQKAIDYVASLPPDANGVRGAVLLLKGGHEVFGRLQITNSGVILRGQGMNAGGTVLVAAGTGRRTLIRIAGQNNLSGATNSDWQIADNYVPVGAMSFRVKDASGLKAGDTVQIIRPSTQAWIDRLGMTNFGGGYGDWRLVWHKGSYDLTWDRVIQKIDANEVTVDAPVTTALQTEFGGGYVRKYSWPGRISHVGVENLRLESAFNGDNPRDESHSWYAITMENADDTWVRQVTFEHFVGTAVAVYESCKWVTVEDCLSLAPVSEIAGWRRNTFFTMGQMTLFLRCWAEHGRHDFSVGFCAAGPNAFVQCEDKLALADSGAIQSWASGTLFDNVRIDGNALSLKNRGSAGEGAGWSAANSVLWQCDAARIACENPPTAQNWAFGSWAEFEGQGIWRSSN